MVDLIDLGMRPVSTQDSVVSSRELLDACPGINLSHDEKKFPPGIIKELRDPWGPVLAIWEGHAVDPTVRHEGSSGGVATALALFAVESEGMEGVLHTVANDARPYQNQSRFSTSRTQILQGTGSRYAPASPAAELASLEHAEKPGVFVGKPCDVAGLRQAAIDRPRLDASTGLTIGFFCAGTPSTRGTLDLIGGFTEEIDQLTDLRYRGKGWPGDWRVTLEDRGRETSQRLSYEESWEFLQSYRQWRCYICPDHTGEFADVSVGDPWYRTPTKGEPGRSLILARTQRGLDAVLSAERAGYLVLEERGPEVLEASQPNLLKARGRLWGQLLTLKALGVPVPNFEGMPTFGTWLWRLSWREKAQSVGGTLRRIRRKRLRHRIPRSESHPTHLPRPDSGRSNE